MKSTGGPAGPGGLRSARPAAYAVGEEVDTAVKLTHGRIGSQAAKAGCPGTWTSRRPTGRSAQHPSGRAHATRGLLRSREGPEELPAVHARAEQPERVPGQVGRRAARATIVTPEVRAQPFDATATIYFTGMRAENVRPSACTTLVEIDTLHSVRSCASRRPARGHEGLHGPAAGAGAGPADSTPTRILLIFNKKQGVIRTNKRCTSPLDGRARYRFFNESPASHNNDVFHRIADPVTASDRAC